MSTPMADDPVLVAINAYRAGMAAFEALPESKSTEDENEAVAATYGPPGEVIDAWDRPATTMAGAVAALRFVLDDYCLEPGCENLLRAALDYLESIAPVTGEAA